MLKLSLNRSRAALRPRSACVGSGVVNCTLLPAPTPHQPPERRLDKENSQSTTWQTSHIKHFMFGWFIAQKQPEPASERVRRGDVGDELTCVPVLQLSFWTFLKAQLSFMIWWRTVRVVRASQNLVRCTPNRTESFMWEVSQVWQEGGQKFTSKSAVSIKGRNLR